MFKRYIQILLSLGLCLAVATAGELVSPDLFIETFDEARDYLADGVDGTGWDGIIGLDDDATANAINASVDREGQLYLESEFGSEYAEDHDPKGPMLFKIVEGNFRATVKLTDYAGTPEEVVYHNNCGLIVRNVNDEDAGPGEDWVSIDYFPIWSCGNFLRTCDDGQRTELCHNSRRWNAHPFLRIERRGTTFRFLSSSDGQAWEEMACSPVERPDFQGLPLTVGMFHATHSDNQGYVAFDDFELQLGFKKAEIVSPVNGATRVDMPPVMEWQAGETATEHEIYFGNSPDTLESMGRQALNETMYLHLLPLDNGQTYYWRVDEIEADGNVITGDVWSFTTIQVMASQPKPEDGQGFVPINTDLSWQQGAGSVLHRVYLGMDRDAVAGAADDKAPEYVGRAIGHNTVLDLPDDLAYETTYYWRVDEDDLRGNLVKGDVWSFTTQPIIEITDPDLKGWWRLDEGAGSAAVDFSGHNAHGTLMNGPQWVTAGAVRGALKFDGIDDYVSIPALNLNTDTATFTAWINPGTNLANMSGLIFTRDGASVAGMNLAATNRLAYHWDANVNDTHLFDSGLIVPVGEWSFVAVVVEPKQATLYLNEQSSVNTYDHVIEEFDGEMMLGFDTYGDGKRRYDGIMDECRVYAKALNAEELADVMIGDPRLASDPSPRNGASVDILGVGTLAWTAGQDAVTHNVYVGTSPTSLSLKSENQTSTTYALADVELNQTYYWRIDEVADDQTVTVGSVWTFYVVDYIIVDDFEHYSAKEDALVYNFWLDGFGCFTDLGGSISGHDTEILVETTIVKGGNKSLPVYFDNDGSFINYCGDYLQPKFSKVMREFETPRNWKNPGGQAVSVLNLWVRGQADNTDDPLYLEIVDNSGKMARVSYTGDTNPVTRTSWMEWRIDLSQVSDTGVNLNSVKKLSIGIGDSTDTQLGGLGVLYVDEIHLYGSDD